MQPLRLYWQKIDWAKSALLGIFIVIAWLLSDRLDQGTKDIAVFAIVFGDIPIQMLRRIKSGRWLRLDHPLSYGFTLAWLATGVVWIVPEMRREYFPPSPAIDNILIVAGVLAAIVLLPKKLSPAVLDAQ
jgi:hypothetical protein